MIKTFGNVRNSSSEAPPASSPSLHSGLLTAGMRLRLQLYPNPCGLRIPANRHPKLANKRGYKNMNAVCQLRGFAFAILLPFGSDKHAHIWFRFRLRPKSPTGTSGYERDSYKQPGNRLQDSQNKTIYNENLITVKVGR